MKTIFFSGRFKKAFDKIDLKENEKKDFKYVIETLKYNEVLDKRFKKHNLKGEYKRYIDIHIRYNLILLIEITEDNNIRLVDIGTHAEVLHL